VIVLGLDIVSKVAVVANLSDRSPVRLLGGFLKLLVSRNPGAAFSIGTSMTIVFTAIAISVIVVILRTSRRIRSIPWAITLGLLLGGATGNLGDRIFRSPGLFRGYVVDWIEVPHWPVFNLADSAIVCGGILAVLLSARGTRLDGLRGISALAGGASQGGSEHAGAQDSVTPDTVTPDTGTPDAGTPDTGTSDTGAQAAGERDAGKRDERDAGERRAPGSGPAGDDKGPAGGGG
jgi:signal peptidase II